MREGRLNPPKRAATKDAAVAMLREFAYYKSDGTVGVVRMLRMQEDAKDLLRRLERVAQPPYLEEM